MLSKKMTGLAGLLWGVLTLLVIIAGFVVVGAAMGGSAVGGGGSILRIIGLIATIALIVMLVGLAPMLGGMGTMACYAAAILAILQTVLPMVGMKSGAVALILTVLFGISLVLVGVFALMDKKPQAGAWKAFAILMIVCGALMAIIVGAIIYPFTACAAGILAFIAIPKHG